jgi:hypothetical protein
MADNDNKLHIDTDWKAQARAEKERLAAEQAKKAEEAKAKSPTAGAISGAPGAEDEMPSGAGGRGMPPADFKTLISTMVTQALFALGEIPDPMTGQRVAHLDLAAHHIDMLGVLEEKTRGNLNDEEKTLVEQAARELRMVYMDRVRQYAAQQAKMAGPGGQPGAGPLGPMPK